MQRHASISTQNPKLAIQIYDKGNEILAILQQFWQYLAACLFCMHRNSYLSAFGLNSDTTAGFSVPEFLYMMSKECLPWFYCLTGIKYIALNLMTLKLHQ